MKPSLSWRRLAAATVAVLALPAAATAHDGSHADTAEHTLSTAFQFDYDALTEPLDPGGTALPCELMPAPGAPGTYQVNLRHTAYRCGIAGTDMEFQSRTDSAGRTHDYAFAGSIGAGFRIWDVTTPATPVFAGGTNVTGYQNDVVIRGDYAMQAYDAASGNAANTSPCLGQGKVGVDVFKLNYDRATAKFNPQLVTCVEIPGGAHTATIHPEGRWLIVSNPGRYAVDFVDLVGLTSGKFTFTNRPQLRYRLIDVTRRTSTNCPQVGASWKCFTVKNPAGQDAVGARNGSIDQGDCYPYDKVEKPCFRPHDVFFSADGNKMFCACLNSTFINDISRLDTSGLSTLANPFPTYAILNNRGEPRSSTTDSSRNVQLSHQADTTPDGRILVVSDERGGGTSETSCNQPGGDIVGALTFYAIAPLTGVPGTSNASLRNAVRLGEWVYPSPTPEELGRKERGCTVHVFRIGGNGAGYPGTGQANAGFGGVSSLSNRQLVTAHYGAGVWYVDFSARPDSKATDTIREDDDTRWGNTLGGIVQPSADLWSAKEYKGNVYAGDLARGFDVYALTKRAY